ncbi:hypothetical protein [Roseimaritima multifibrata]|uniref:hypothetical protein n=1 Tax=Roseimaritima multifibrata TaxID=1930274 RepID=UPI0011A835B8|nr:hypothetical protein [Roseimaritima multifibrata]
MAAHHAILRLHNPEIGFTELRYLGFRGLGASTKIDLSTVSSITEGEDSRNDPGDQHGRIPNERSQASNCCNPLMGAV